MTILDASSLINLINSGVLTKILCLTQYSFAIGPQALEECASQRDLIANFIGQGLTALPDDGLSASLFFTFLEQYGLGLGETECLTLAVQHDGNVCSDDRRARQMCLSVLGKDRVIGSARLLREAVLAGFLTAGEALDAYHAMKLHGAYLPSIPADYWSSEP